MDIGEDVRYLLKHYFDLREAFPITDADIAPSWEAVAKMTTLQQIELLEKIVFNQKFHYKLPTIFRCEAQEILKTIDREKFRTP